MYEARQRVFLDLGEGGCYYLVLVDVAEECLERRIDAVPVFLEAAAKGWCELTGEQAGLLYKPEEILGSMYPARWAMHKEGPLYVCQPGEFEVQRWERPTPKMIYSHFVRGYGDGSLRVKYDPLGSSKTVADGKLVSKRIFSMLFGG